MSTPSATPDELQRARKAFADAIAALPLTDAARLALTAAASSWAKAAATAATSQR